MSEFVRNQLLFRSYWVEHYRSLGLVFPEKALNGAVWGLWSLGFSVLILLLSKRFSVLRAALIAWLASFVLMWLTVGNLGVLPTKLLLWAIPLSMLECLLASWITHKQLK